MDNETKNTNMDKSSQNDINRKQDSGQSGSTSGDKSSSGTQRGSGGCGCGA